MNYRHELIMAALEEDLPVPVDMVQELIEAGYDISPFINNIDGFQVEEF